MMQGSDEKMMMNGRHGELLLNETERKMMELRLRTLMPAPDDTEPEGL
jgi:hypothetical protein